MKRTWETAKKAWEKSGRSGMDAATLKQMGKDGWDKGDFGKKLAAVDKANDLLSRRVAWASASKQANVYKDLLDAAVSSRGVTRDGALALKKLVGTIDELLKRGGAATQDPEPSGRAKRVRLVAQQNAAGGVRTKWLEVGAIDIHAYLVIDEELARLEKDGELGFHFSEVQTTCADLVKRTSDAFAKTIDALDEKIGMLDGKDRADKVKEANEVLKHYAKVVERNVNKAVDDYWDRALKRRKYLANFKREVKIDMAVATVTIAVSSVSIAMSFGAAAISALAIAKAALELALSIEKYTRDADAVKKKLEPKMKDIQKLWKKREAAKAKGEGQRGSKAVEVLKEAAASAIGQAAREVLTTTSRTLKEATEFTGKLTAAEEEAGKLYKQIELFTEQFPSAPEGPDARQNKQMAKTFMKFKAMGQQYADFAAALRQDIAWGERSVEICEKLADEDYVPQWTKTAGTATKSAIGLTAVAKVTYQLATALI
jgi:hypothetical protein